MQSLLESRTQTAAKGAASDTTADILLRMTSESLSGSFSQQKFGSGTFAGQLSYTIKYANTFFIIIIVIVIIFITLHFFERPS